MRTLLRWIARPLLAAVFAWDGIDALRNPQDHVERFRKTEPTLEKLGLPPLLTSDAKLLSQVTGALTTLSAAGLALGKWPRLNAAVLALVNLPITVVNNPVWTIRDPQRRQDATRGLVVGASLAGGLGMAMLDNLDRLTRKQRKQALAQVKSQALK